MSYHAELSPLTADRVSLTRVVMAAGVGLGAEPGGDDGRSAGIGMARPGCSPLPQRASQGCAPRAPDVLPNPGRRNCAYPGFDAKLV
jgi:hypothetical protein